MTDFQIIPGRPEDAAAVASLMKTCRDRGETLYRPLTAAEVLAAASRPGRALRVIYGGQGAFAGFMLLCEKTVFLPKENAENTPAYLTLLMIEPAYRNKGCGTALLEAAADWARKRGKSRLVIGSDQPEQLTWLIPGTPGHDHNNAPGIWEEGGAVDWFARRGFETAFREMSLYINLKDYHWDPALDDRIKALRAQGIRTGIWEPAWGRDYDGMCDRVGSEYWRHVLRTEIAAWDTGKPNADPALWPDGRQPAGPRPFLAAAKDGQIIGFTGPLDQQESGRGWFTGICADPLYGGRGIGTVLFNLLLRLFRERGAAFCSIFTGVNNPAQRIYLRAGLRVTSHWSVLSRAVGDGCFESYHYF